MKHLFFFLFLVLGSSSLRAQTAYEYDSAGNRISRTPVMVSLFQTEDTEGQQNEVTMSVSPSPTAGPFTLTITGADTSAGYSVRICDAYGTVITTANGTTPTLNMDITAQRNGYYLVFVTLNGQQYCKKIVKQ